MFIGHFGWGGGSTHLLTLSPLNQVPPPSGYAVLEDRGSSPSLCPLSPACVTNLSLCPRALPTSRAVGLHEGTEVTVAHALSPVVPHHSQHWTMTEPQGITQQA